MKYPPALLTPFLAALPSKAPVSVHYRSLISHQGTPLSGHASIACSLLNSLTSLFATPVLCFQSFADSFCKMGGWGYPARFSRLPRALFERGSSTSAPYLFSRTYKSLPAPARPHRSLFSVTCKSLGGQTLSFHIHTKPRGCQVARVFFLATRHSSLATRFSCYRD
jgi:hypothetical protein